jgi:hypothetical protein
MFAGLLGLAYACADCVSFGEIAKLTPHEGNWAKDCPYTV